MNDYRKECYKLSIKVAEAMTLKQLREFVADEIYQETKCDAEMFEYYKTTYLEERAE